MARKRTASPRRDPNIVVERSAHGRRPGGRMPNGRRPARPKGPPWIIIGAMVLAAILLILPFTGVLKHKPKNPSSHAPAPIAVEEDIFRHQPADEAPWGPLHVGMTKSEVLKLKLGELFDSAREGDHAAQTYKNKETWIYTIESGGGGIFHEGGGAKLWVIFKNPEGTVQYMKHPLRAVWNEDKTKLKNEPVTYEDLLRRHRELADR